MTTVTTALPAEYRQLFEPFMREPPVDVLGCAQAAGLPIYGKALGYGISGMIIRSKSSPSGFICYVDTLESAVRQRFTAAHELGHFVLHRDKIGETHEDNYLLRAEGMTNSQEAAANRFAADLLMPYSLIDQAMNSGTTSMEDLADLFKVSRVAMSIRLGLPT